MSSTTTHPSTGSAPSFPCPPQPLPTLAQLYQMTCVPEKGVVIPGVEWAYYEQMADSIPPGVNLHADYDGKAIEPMCLSGFHDGIKKRMVRFMELVAEEQVIPCQVLGETTWKRPVVAHGLEADECYCLAAEKLTRIAQAVVRMS